jgi:hypothetical protein
MFKRFQQNSNFLITPSPSINFGACSKKGFQKLYFEKKEETKSQNSSMSIFLFCSSELYNIVQTIQTKKRTMTETVVNMQTTDKNPTKKEEDSKQLEARVYDSLRELNQPNGVLDEALRFDLITEADRKTFQAESEAFETADKRRVENMLKMKTTMMPKLADLKIANESILLLNAGKPDAYVNGLLAQERALHEAKLNAFWKQYKQQTDLHIAARCAEATRQSNMIDKLRKGIDALEHMVQTTYNSSTTSMMSATTTTMSGPPPTTVLGILTEKC